VERLEDRTAPALVAAYAFNEGAGTTVTDASGNGHTGTIVNATWATAGKYGDALSFNGTNAMVTIPDASSFHLTTGMTLEAWVNPSAVSNAWRDVIYKGNDNFYLSATSTSSSHPAVGAIVNGSYLESYGTSALATNKWTFLAATYDGTTMRLYVNAAQVSSKAGTGSILTSTNSLQIGGDSFYGQFFQGTIDEVRVYNSALTAAQLTTDMNTPIPSVPLVASAGPNVSGNEGTAIQFTGSAGGGTAPYSYSWNFGDGSPATTGTLTPTHVYASDGPYTATLTVTDSANHTAPASTSVTVNNVAPTVSAGGPYGGSPGVAISFTGTATVPDPKDPLTYLWNFGDGGTSTLQNPTHTYATANTYTVTLQATDSEGASTTSTSTTATVTAPSPLVVSAGPNVSGNEGSAIQFTGSASGGTGTLSYSWSFGDGSPATTGTLTPTHVYASDGPYSATLTVTDSANHTAPASTAVTVNNVPPTVSAGGPYTGNPGTAISFSGTASVPDPKDTLTYLWSFGDGGTSTLQNPTHTYATPNTYTVTLQATDSEGTSTTASTVVYTSPLTVVGTPTTDANGVVSYSVVSPSLGVQPQTLRILAPTHPAAGQPPRFLYLLSVVAGLDNSFGDGMLAAEQLDLEDQYNATLVAPSFPISPWYADSSTDPTAQLESFMVKALVPWVNQTQAAPGTTPAEWLVGFSKSGFGALSLILRNPTVFTAAACWDAPVQTTSVTTFSDMLANYGTQQNFANYEIPTLVAQDSAPFQTTNRIWISGDNGLYTSQMVTLDQQMRAAGIQHTFVGGVTRAHNWTSGWLPLAIQGLAPLVASAGPNVSGSEGSAIQFNASASGGTGALTYAWTFGDGGTANTLTPTHVYASDGPYTATLTVTDSANRTATASTSVTVNNVPPTVSAGGPYTGTAGAAISFSGTASVPDPKDTLTYLWSFGDGGTSTLQNPTHIYTTANTYTVTLQATDSEGGSTTSASTTATVAPPSPLVANAGPNVSGNEGSAIQFTGSASGGTGTLSYSWSFGDGSPATTGTLTPTHVYASDGPYTATLTVTDSANHTAPASTAVTVNNVPPTVSAGGPYTGTAGAAISFSGTASVPDPNDTISYLWSFGDGGTSTLQNPTQT
jgi:PKD repeat protein